MIFSLTYLYSDKKAQWMDCSMYWKETIPEERLMVYHTHHHPRTEEGVGLLQGRNYIPRGHVKVCNQSWL